MKKLYFGSNFKMYKTAAETVAYLQLLSGLTEDLRSEEIELFIIPSYTALEQAVFAVRGKNIKIGAQNMCWEDAGQFTGEISPVMLKEAGVDLVMIGHSERRNIFGETNIEENKKVRAALKHNFTALLCIGETAEEKKMGIGGDILRAQLKTGLYGAEKTQTDKILIAYEPVWSIGIDGTAASSGYAENMQKTIKKCLKEMFGTYSENIPVLYGGSVNQDNAGELIRQPSIDGLFVGRAAWEAKAFSALIRSALAERFNERGKAEI